MGATYNGTESITAENNWWGCNAGPGQAGCDALNGTGSANIDANPWLVLGVSANPTTISVGQPSLITASLGGNSNGQTPSGNTFPSGVSVAFGTTLGSIPSPVLTSSPFAISALSSASGGTANVSATLDGQTVATPVTVIAPPTTPAAGGTLGQTQPGGKAKKCKKKKKRKKGAAAAKMIPRRYAGPRLRGPASFCPLFFDHLAPRAGGFFRRLRTGDQGK
jgi:hypothetical protein